jgi:hypothetical protein
LRLLSLEIKLIVSLCIWKTSSASIFGCVSWRLGRANWWLDEMDESRARANQKSNNKRLDHWIGRRKLGVAGGSEDGIDGS